MTKPFLALLCLPCFALGWWLDAKMMDRDTVGNKFPVTQNGSGLKSVAPRKRPSQAPDPLAPPAVIQSPADLLNLIIPRRAAGTTARLKSAIETLSLKQLAQFAAKLEAGSEPYQLVIERWIALDPVPGIEWAMQREYEDFGPIYTGILEIFKSDRATAVRLLAMYPQDNRGDFLITRGDCIELMEGDNPQDALRFILEMDLRMRSDLQTPDYMGQFGAQWAKTDAVAAMNWALSQPPGHTRREILAQMASAWGQLDASAARAFLDQVPKSQLPSGSLRERLLSAIDSAAEAKEGQSKP